MIKAKQIQDLPIRPHELPLDYKIPAYMCTSAFECSRIETTWNPGMTTDDHAMGNMGSGAWMIFQALFIPVQKTYNIDLRYACGHTNVTEATFSLLTLEHRTTQTLTLPVTGGWGNYQTVSSTIGLREGFNHIRLLRNSGSESINVDFLRIRD